MVIDHHPDYQRLIATLNDYQVADPCLLAAMVAATDIIKLAADEPLIRSGQKPESFYVIREGLVRYYYLSDGGKVRNKVFFREGQFCGSLSALLTDTPCGYTIEAIEPSVVYALPLNLMDGEVGSHEQMQRLRHRLTEEMFLRNERREAVLLTCNAEARYQWLLDNESWLLSRLPQYHLASYLGMDAVSLSRIKKKLSADDVS